MDSAYAATVLASLAGLASGYWLWRARSRLTVFDARAATLAAVWALAWWLFGGSVEIEGTVSRSIDYGVLLSFAAASALLLHGLCVRLAWPLLDLLAAFVVLAALALGLVPIETFGHRQPNWGGSAGHCCSRSGTRCCTGWKQPIATG